MELHEIRDLYDREQRIELEVPVMRREVQGGVIRHVHPGGEDGVVLYSWLTAENADAAIEEQIAYFESIGCGFEWKAYGHDTPPDLVARLVARGFEPEEVEAVVVLDLTEAPEAVWGIGAHDVQLKEGTTGLADVVAVEEAVWQGDRAWLGRWLAEEIEATPDSLRIYVAYADGRPVSCGWIRFSPRSQFAGLWGGSTLPEYRGRGIYHALVSARAQEARRRGTRFLTVDAGPMSRPILERLGFRTMAMAHACQWHVRRS